MNVFVSNRDSINFLVVKRIVKVLTALVLVALGEVVFLNSNSFSPHQVWNEKYLKKLVSSGCFDEESKSVVASNQSKSVVTNNQSEALESLSLEDCGIVWNNEFIALGATISLEEFSEQFEVSVSESSSVGVFFHNSKSFEVIAVGNSENGYRIWSIHSCNSEVSTSRGVKLLSSKESAESYYPNLFGWKGYQEFSVDEATVAFNFQSGLLVEYYVSF